MLNNYKLICWDFDGTFADTSAGIYASIKYVCDNFGLEFPIEEKLRTFIGPPLNESFANVFGLNNEESNNAVKKYREFYVDGGMLMLDFYPDVIDFVKLCNSKGIKTAICSNKPKRFVKAIAEHFDFIEYIDIISCPENDSQKLSKCQMITNALEYLNIEKQSTLMIGDRYLDIIGATEAGVDSCGAVYGYGTKEELLNSGSKYLIDNISDLKKIVFSFD